MLVTAANKTRFLFIRDFDLTWNRVLSTEPTYLFNMQPEQKFLCINKTYRKIDNEIYFCGIVKCETKNIYYYEVLYALFGDGRKIYDYGATTMMMMRRNMMFALLLFCGIFVPTTNYRLYPLYRIRAVCFLWWSNKHASLRNPTRTINVPKWDVRSASNILNDNHFARHFYVIYFHVLNNNESL